jgi:hypothetical protein
VQQIAELDDVPLGLIGQRLPASTFMSAQQHGFGWGAGTDSAGRTGVREPRLSATIANNSRAGSFITPHITTGRSLRKTRDSTGGVSCATRKSDAEQDYDFADVSSGVGGSADAHFGATVHSVQRIESESLSTRLLRKQKLLRDINEKHSSSLSAAREKCFRT